jgi:uncharacterized protein (DUF4415 family)
MNGLVTTMTSKEMQQARLAGKSQSDWDAVRTHIQQGGEPAEDHDAPDASQLMLAELTKRRAGRPAGSGNKEQVAIRFDREVLTAFRSTGAGWQTKMNAALKDWLASHNPNSALSS